MTSFVAVPQNTLYFNLKHRKNAKIFACAFGVPKVVDLSIFLSIGGLASLEKFLPAPMTYGSGQLTAYEDHGRPIFRRAEGANENFRDFFDA